jgi:hypothetical protein
MAIVLDGTLGTTTPALTDSALTSGRVTYAGTSGVLQDSAGLTFDGTGLSVTGSTSATLKLNGRSSDNASSANFYDNTGATRYGFLYFDPSIGGQIATTNANPLAFAINSSEQMRLTSTGLGIGTSSPANTLNIVKDNTSFRGQLCLQTVTASNYAQITFYDRTDLGAQIFQAYTATSGVGSLTIQTATASALVFGTSATERMRLDTSGNLGIGATANASAILDAQSTTKGVRMPNMTTTQKNAISSPAAGLMVFDTTLAKLCVYSGSAWQTITSV